VLWIVQILYASTDFHTKFS